MFAYNNTQEKYRSSRGEFMYGLSAVQLGRSSSMRSRTPSQQCIFLLFSYMYVYTLGVGVSHWGAGGCYKYH